MKKARDPAIGPPAMLGDEPFANRLPRPADGSSSLGHAAEFSNHKLRRALISFHGTESLQRAGLEVKKLLRKYYSVANFS